MSQMLDPTRRISIFLWPSLISISSVHGWFSGGDTRQPAVPDTPGPLSQRLSLKLAALAADPWAGAALWLLQGRLPSGLPPQPLPPRGGAASPSSAPPPSGPAAHPLPPQVGLRSLHADEHNVCAGSVLWVSCRSESPA